MSRIRNIKPGFFTDEEITELSRDCRLFFIGLWTECDKCGVFKWKPKELKIKLFSCDLDITSDSIADFLETLLLIDFVRKFNHGGDPFGWVVEFQEHQWISKSESEKGATLAPVPKRWPSGKLPGTNRARAMGVSPDLGHLTKDYGRRTDDAGAPVGAVPPPAISNQGKAGQPAWMPKIRAILAEEGYGNNNTDCQEWKGALTTRAKINDPDELRAFLKWALPFVRSRHAEGEIHLRHTGSLPDEWQAKRKEVLKEIA